jgi:hypothetical protein
MKTLRVLVSFVACCVCNSAVANCGETIDRQKLTPLVTRLSAVEVSLLNFTYSQDLLREEARSEEQRLSEAVDSLMRIEMSLSSLEMLLSIRDVMIHPKDRESVVRFARLHARNVAQQAQLSYKTVTRLLVNARRAAVATELVKARDMVAEVLGLLRDCQ